MTATPPTTAGFILKSVLVADSATSGYFVNYIGKVIPGSSATTVWNNAVSNAVTLAAFNGYVCSNGATLITFTIPALAAIGDTYTIIGNSSGGWRVQANAGQIVNVLATPTTVAGTITFQNRYDCITITCTVANTTFTAIPAGNLTVL